MNRCNCRKKYSSQKSILNFEKPVKLADLSTSVLTFEKALRLFGRMNK
jgi:hypothetical protein